MTDKVQKIREEVVRMHNLLPVTDGDNITVNYADRICTTLEMYIDSLQEEPVSDEQPSVILYGLTGSVGSPKEEPVSEDLKEASRNYADNEEYGDDVYFAIKAAFEAGAKWQKTKDESTTEDLGEYINELSKQFQEVSFAKLSRIAVRVAKWQAEQMMAKAVDGKVIANGMGNPILHLWDKGRHLIGKKVKVIVIKED